MKKALILLLIPLLLLPTVTPTYAAEPTVTTAKSALLYCLHTDSVLYAKNADEKIATGNTAQLMTALLTLEAYPDLNTDVTLTGELLPGWYTPDDYRTLADYGFNKGATVSVKDLLAASVIENANSATLLLASLIAGSKSAFTEKMNLRAKELGMENTVFQNPAGYDAEGAYTTAEDILILARLLYQNAAFMSLASAPSYLLTSSGSRIYTRNYMLGKWYTAEYLYTNANGMKAGYTEQSGNTLVATSTEKDGYSYLAIVLGGEDRNFKNTAYQIAKDLFSWGSTSFALREILTNAELITTLPVKNADHQSTVNVFPKKSLDAYLNKSLDLDELEVSYTLIASELEAPFEPGTVVGEISVSYQGEVLDKTELIVANGATRAQNANLKARLRGLVKPILVISLGIGAIALGKWLQKRKSRNQT